MADSPPLQTREEIEELEREIERLRVMYQQYFMGTLKTEPLNLRKSIYRKILGAKPGQIMNTGTRFKLRNAIQKWNGYLNLWKRTVRQIEEGSYKRDVNRMRARAQARGEAGANPANEERPPPVVVEIDDNISAAELERQLQAAMVAEVAKTDTPPPRSHTPNSQAADERLVQRLMERQAQGLPLDEVDLTALGED